MNELAEFTSQDTTGDSSDDADVVLQHGVPSYYSLHTIIAMLRDSEHADSFITFGCQLASCVINA